MTSKKTPDEYYLLATFEWLRARFAQMLHPRAAGTAGSREQAIYDRRVVEAKQLVEKALESLGRQPSLWILVDRFQPFSDEQSDEAGTQRLERVHEFERNVLLLCLGVELDPLIAQACEVFHGKPERSVATLGLARQLFLESDQENVFWTAIAEDQPLRRWRLIEAKHIDGVSLTDTIVRASAWATNIARGRYAIDRALERLATRLDAYSDIEHLPLLSISQTEEAPRVAHQIKLNQGQPGLTIQLVGQDASIHELYARWLVGKLSRISNVGHHVWELFSLKAGALPIEATEVEEFCLQWERESIWRPMALFVDAQQLDLRPGTPAALAVHRIAEGSGSPLLLSVREAYSQTSPKTISVTVNRPTPTEQHEAWRELLQDEESQTPARLASQFNLSFATIAEIGHTVTGTKATAIGDVRVRKLHPRHDDLWDECLRRTRPRLNQMAQQIETKATFDDIVLPAQQNQLLRQIVDQAEHRYQVYDQWKLRAKLNRGLGISALFAGESGTGKTMAAEVIANRLRLPLYRIDLSAVVSKYIGETEKNLRQMFDAFDDGGAVLFFDEADSLFGKRSEVKDSHDRYANIQIDYLLQRMESFSGLAILATNMKSALDTAFLRRLRFVVDFPLPETDERRRIWESAVPPEVPREETDFDRLAQFRVSGGNIQTIVINALFQAAASEGGVLTMQHLLEATRNEYHKLQRTINESDFKDRKNKRNVA